MAKEVKQFKVLIYKMGKIEYYDVLPYFRNCWKEKCNTEEKDKIKTSMPEVDLTELDENICLSVYITFEDGGNTFLQTGEFLPDFAGKITFELSDSKDEDLILRLKAGEGLFQSTLDTGCDDVYYINPKDGYID
jgi:hypothetical protein